MRIQERIGIQSFLEWLAQAGLPGAGLELREKLLILKLSGSGRSRLLADARLRQRVIAQAKTFGFDRVGLELTLDSSAA